MLEEEEDVVVDILVGDEIVEQVLLPAGPWEKITRQAVDDGIIVAAVIEQPFVDDIFEHLVRDSLGDGRCLAANRALWKAETQTSNERIGE